VGLTAELCALIHATRYDALDGACIHKVKQAIKDGVAVALAGCRERPVALMVSHMQSLGGLPQAGVWGWNARLSSTQAAYVNAVATHVLDFEPMWSPPTHSVSPTVPVAFALAESRRLGGRDIIAAVAKGLEIQGRLQYAGDQYVPEALRFHPPGVAGVLGSAVVAGHLLGLDALRLQHALGIAASRAGSLLANVGSMTKCSHCGNAAAGGLDAALLADRGFTANPDVLEAPKGFVATFYPDGFDPERLLAYGRPFRVVDPGLAIKLFPSQFGTHYAITAGLEVRSRLPRTDEIERVHVISPVMKYVDRPRPATGLDGKFSLQYVTAAALLDGKVTIDTFTDDRRFRPDMVQLLERVTLAQDEAIPGDFHHMHVTVEAVLRDGSRLRAVCHAPKGSWGVPLAEDDHRAKLEDCLRRRLTHEATDAVLERLDRLEDLDAAGVAGLVDAIACPGT
jgi:2-methylcitrate dehydratase PrpD